jgi:hypothetical protein
VVRSPSRIVPTLLVDAKCTKALGCDESTTLSPPPNYHLKIPTQLHPLPCCRIVATTSFSSHRNPLTCLRPYSFGWVVEYLISVGGDGALAILGNLVRVSVSSVTSHSPYGKPDFLIACLYEMYIVKHFCDDSL